MAWKLPKSQSVSSLRPYFKKLLLSPLILWLFVVRPSVHKSWLSLTFDGRQEAAAVFPLGSHAPNLRCFSRASKSKNRRSRTFYAKVFFASFLGGSKLLLQKTGAKCPVQWDWKMGTYSCRKIDNRVKRTSSFGVKIYVPLMNESLFLACSNFRIYGRFRLWMRVLLKKPIFSSCGSTIGVEKGVETTYSLE